MFFIFGCLSFSGPEGLRNSWNVAGPVSSDGFFPIICVFNLGVAFQLREPNFSPSSSLLFLASYHVGAPVSLSLFLQFQVSSWVKGKALDGSGRFKLFFFFFSSVRAHSGHCVWARNNIYSSPLWAPRKQSRYWSPKWTYTAVFIVRSLSIKTRGGEKQHFQHIPWHLLANWLFCWAVCIFQNSGVGKC